MLDVVLYAMLEVSLPIETPGVDPYDPAAVVVQAEITTPSTTQVLPAYFDGTGWMLRYRPVTLGSHTAEITVDGVVADTLVFEVAAGNRAGPWQADGWGFRGPDGRSRPTIGLNLGWSSGGGTEDYARWFERLAGSGGTLARVWVTHISAQNPEWPVLGQMDPAAAARIDALLDEAERQDVGVILVLWQHSQLPTLQWSSWDANPYNVDNGGPCPDAACFFTDPAAAAYQDRYQRYALARWGAHPALAMWEVMNEVDGVQGVDTTTATAWARQRARSIRSAEDGLHPVSWSYALPPQVLADQDWEGADWINVHSYLPGGVTPIAEGVAAVADQGKPVMVSEWGLDWGGALDLEDVDGAAWHTANWAALASGSSGNAMTWWWDNHIEPDDLWWRLETVSDLAAGVDLASMRPIEVQLEEPDDVGWLARGNADTGLVWVYDTGTGPERVVPGMTLLPPDGVGEVVATFLDPASGASLGQARGRRIPLPSFTGDLAVLLDYDPPPVKEPAARGCGCAQGPSGAPWWTLALWGVLWALPRQGLRTPGTGRTPHPATD